MSEADIEDMRCPLCKSKISKRFVKVEDIEELIKDAKTIPASWLMSLIIQRSEGQTK